MPFYLCSGKRLTQKATSITLQFKQVPPLLFSESADLTLNSLSLCIQPDEGMHEIELAWRLIDPLTVERDPLPYPRGSASPAGADALLARDGREWIG